VRVSGKLPHGVSLSDCVIIAFCDPAGRSKSAELKRIRARSAIIVIAVDPLRRVFVIFAWAEKCTPEKLAKEIEDVLRKYKPKMFGIEANAMQSLFADLVRARCRQAGLRSALVPITQPTHVDKDFRITTAIQPVMANGRLFLHRTMVELLAELRGFPTHRLKDLVDALASAIALAPKRTLRSVASDHRAALEKYLRRSGASEDYVRQRLAEMENDDGRPREQPRRRPVTVSTAG
jgi:predicted phage terminase large subunit-like protein